jgi:hypothetical protein
MKEYDLYVPLHSNDGTPIPTAQLARLKKRLIQRFGGLTQFPQSHEGFWEIGSVTFRDKILILRVLSKEGPGESRRFWRQIKTTLKQQWRQQEILIVAKEVTLT